MTLPARVIGAIGIAALAIAALIVFAFTRPVSAQEQRVEPHDWISLNRDYTAPSGAHCCGPIHCRPALPGELEPTPTGWRHLPTGTELKIGIAGIYASRDIAGRTYVCIWPMGMACVFPGGGA